MLDGLLSTTEGMFNLNWDHLREMSWVVKSCAAVTVGGGDAD